MEPIEPVKGVFQFEGDLQESVEKPLVMVHAFYYDLWRMGHNPYSVFADEPIDIISALFPVFLK